MFIGIIDIYYNYNIESWVWLCMEEISGWGANSGFFGAA